MINRDQAGRLGTLTTDGWIAHLRIQAGAHILDAPVQVRVIRRGTDQDTVLRPVVNAYGRYVHVLPGGEKVEGEYKR